MEAETADHIAFNSFPENPAFITEFPNLNSQSLTSLPLHRHTEIRNGEYIVWTLHKDRLTAKPTQVGDPKTLVPMFWTKRGIGSILAYEFVDSDTAKHLDVIQDQVAAEAIAALVTNEVPEGFGISALWTSYAQYISETYSADIFLDSQELLVSELMKSAEMLELANRMKNGDFLDPPIKCKGVKIPNFDRPVSFVEMDVGHETHMFVVSQGFLESIENEVPSFPLCAGGAYLGHYIEKE